MIIFYFTNKKSTLFTQNVLKHCPKGTITQVKKYFHYSLSNYYLNFLFADTILYNSTINFKRFAQIVIFDVKIFEE